MNFETKILNNIFLNTTDNMLVPANIYFNDRIRKIEPLYKDEIKWDDIASIEAKEKLISRFTIKELPSIIEQIDGKFNLAIPGAIDPHVHFDSPGFEFRDTFEHGTTAAAYGGITSIIDMPCTSIPPVTSLKNFTEKLNIVKDRALVDFAFWGGVCGNSFEKNSDVEKNIFDLNEAGVASYKGYLISGMESFKDLTIDQMIEVARIISKTNKPLGVHAEDKFLVESRRQEYLRNNQNSWEYYCSARDELAEELAVKSMIDICRETEAKVHIVHLSSELGLRAIKKAQKKGINITTETCSHYLKFTENDFNNPQIRNFLKTAPPVKKEHDLDSLWNGLSDNSIEFVTTDHAGCNPQDEKSEENFWKVYGGIPGVEHRVPHLFSEGFKNGKLTIDKTIKLLSTNAANYFNLKNKGEIKENYDADIALINLWDREKIYSENMHSKGKYTPFEGMTFDCRVDKTILRGNVIMDREGSVEKKIGYGQFIEVK